MTFTPLLHGLFGLSFYVSTENILFLCLFSYGKINLTVTCPSFSSDRSLNFDIFIHVFIIIIIGIMICIGFIICTDIMICIDIILIDIFTICISVILT